MTARRFRLIALTLGVSLVTMLGASVPRPVEPAAWVPDPVLEPVQNAPGKALYLTSCKACHGVLGVPTKLSVKKYEKIPDLTDPAFWSGRSADSVVAVLRKGVGRDMKSFSEKLSADEMRSVALYARSLVRTP